MKIGMLTWGSHGDIRPFLALADGLQAAGHQVHLVITSLEAGTYDKVRSAAGARITILTPHTFSAEQAQAVGQAAYSTRDPMKQMAAILRLAFAPAEDAMFAAAQRLCEESDLLVGHYFMHPLQIAAEHAGLPYVSVLLTHAGVPSDYVNPLGLAMFGKPGNRLLWWLTRTLLNRTVRHYPDRLRRQLGMPPVRDIVSEVWISPRLALVAVSPQICGRAPDWPDSIQVCGFLDRPNCELEGDLPPSLTAFLAAGEAPVYMTFGSWMPRDIKGQTEALRLLTDTARTANCRAIIQCHDWQACGFQSNGQILYVAAAPHHLIFPHCLAILHHGGAGTTQSASLAGKPSIVVANISEQEHWGRELQRIGIAGKPARRRNATAAALAAQIRHVRASPAMGERALQIGLAMRQENGVAQAVRQIGLRFGPAAID
ncbi:glycosyltransferase [Pseudoduganella violaceinigra]|uniref:glycosyltransferase n=1 Tax=Pseudoduganella violaceinigra TaxID=246602 RepID=UPI000428D823|nr:glycosyltransferase [Pseudoduganella violaceinigra]